MTALAALAGLEQAELDRFGPAYHAARGYRWAPWARLGYPDAERDLRGWVIGWTLGAEAEAWCPRRW